MQTSSATMQESRAGQGSISRIHPAVTISFFILIVLALSMLVFSQQSLRLDEAQSLWQTSHSIPAMVAIVAEDVHVPLYHLLLHFWQFAFGNDVITTRMLSLIFFVLMLPAVYALGKLAYGERVGIFSMILMAISPFLNWYGNEIRMYSLFVLLTVLNQYFFISIFLKDREDRDLRGGIWLGYAVTLILGMFTHYFFVLNALTQALFYVAYRQIFPKGAFRTFMIVLMLVLVVFAPWTYYVFTLGSASNTQPILTAPTTIDVFNTFSQFIFGFQNDHINTILVSLWPLLVLLVFLALRRNQRVTPTTVYLFFSMFLPVFIVFIVSLGVKPIYLSRYLILTLPSLYLLISWILSVYPKRLAYALKTILILVMLATLGIEIVNANTPVKENYREASAYLSAKTAPQDVIVVSAPFTIYPVEYYYRGPAVLETLPRWNRLINGPIPVFSEERLPQEVEAIKDDHQTLWLLLSYDQGYEEQIRLYFDTHLERVETRNFSPGLNLYVYRLRYDVSDVDRILEESRPD